MSGKYISQSGELMFRFTADSLYIDIAQSQRNISAFKLVRNSEDNKDEAFLRERILTMYANPVINYTNASAS